jgi:hypothetical protein
MSVMLTKKGICRREGQLREERQFLRKRMDEWPQAPAAVQVDSDLSINIARLPPHRFLQALDPLQRRTRCRHGETFAPRQG